VNHSSALSLCSVSLLLANFLFPFQHADASFLVFRCSCFVLSLVTFANLVASSTHALHALLRSTRDSHNSSAHDHAVFREHRQGRRRP
jgi:hypothetical protein